MNNNKSLNMSRGGSSDLSESDCTAMTAEELALYREVLEAAYPKPKRDIKAGVMAAVRRDAAVKKKRRELRPLIMKWGGLAASIVIVAAIGIRVLPAFLSDDLVAADTSEPASVTQTDSTASETSVSAAETAAESANGSAAGSAEVPSAKRAPAGEGLFTAMIPQPSDSDTEDDAPAEEAEAACEAASDEAYYEVYSAEPTADKSAEDLIAAEAEADEPVTEEAAEEEAVAEEAPAAALYSLEEAPAEENVTEAVLYSVSPTAALPDDDTALVITSECTHEGVFGGCYHNIPDVLIDEVGIDEYELWAKEAASPSDPCTVNIRSFIEHFGISEDAFTMYILTTDMAYYCDYPVEVLYGSAEACESYYSSGGNYGKMIADNFEYSLKLALAEEISEDEYAEWIGKFAYPTVRAWSISEFLTDHSIPEYRFLEIYNDAADAYKAEYDVDELQSYDTTKLYVPAFGIKFALAASQYGYDADVSCRK